MKRCCSCQVSKIEKLIMALNDHFGGEAINFLIEINLKVEGFDAPVYQKLEIGKKEHEDTRVGGFNQIIQEEMEE
jgi:hypothetical protein